MLDSHSEFLGKAFLRSVWSLDYAAFKDTPEEQELLYKLKVWSVRKDLKETTAEGPFVDTFFRGIWGYGFSGQDVGKAGFTLYPKYPIGGAGDNGGTGEADLAIGWFDRTDVADMPQVLCEFKDIRSSLDAPQKSRKNQRSPVKQCLDYLAGARKGMFGNEAILPTWGVVTDMNEFRLYWYDRAPHQYLRFVIAPTDLFQGAGLLATTEDGRFDRFLFWKIFHRDSLLSTGGRSLLGQLIARQWVRERELENNFYSEYRDFRSRLYNQLIAINPAFPGTKGRLVRLAQRILDRCIFVFFCEDMGQALSFPPQLLRDFLIHESQDPYFDPGAQTIWQRLIALFKAMNDGTQFGGKKINKFNGGLFATDVELESLSIPNGVFCHPGQGQNEASLNAYKDTLLYLSASYNYASGWAKGVTPLPGAAGSAESLKGDPLRNLGLYTLGRIFEQSITELEILEAEADGLLSINKESKRKTDGVYYTPEWVVERIISETIGVRLSDLKAECGWPANKLPSVTQVTAYGERLKSVKILDPACGSGAFLITSLRYLINEWHTLEAIRREVTGKILPEDDVTLTRDILRSNIYGVDINSASVEITQLALWLHTVRGDKPLSTLSDTVKDGNSLIDGGFFKGQIDLVFYDEVEKERLNTFDWQQAFPEVFALGGFDVVVGNPPYVKLQNFRKVHSDMAAYLREGRGDVTPYESTQKGNFDLYVPFIERGLLLLNGDGRMGFIAPSLWTVNDYGECLRSLISRTKQLDRWLDFQAFQVFEEATIYTALQFFSAKKNDFVRIAFAPNGVLPDDPWGDAGSRLSYDQLGFGDRWLLLSGPERALIDRLSERFHHLGDPAITSAIFQGVKTGADDIYKLDRSGPGKFHCSKADHHVDIEDFDYEEDRKRARHQALRDGRGRYLPAVPLRSGRTWYQAYSGRAHGQGISEGMEIP